MSYQDKLERLSQFDDADTVATYLLAIGVRGDRAAAGSCPIATYLSDSRHEVYVTRYATTVYRRETSDTIWDTNNPMVVSDFVARFDTGSYPWLERDNQEFMLIVDSTTGEALR